MEHVQYKDIFLIAVQLFMVYFINTINRRLKSLEDNKVEDSFCIQKHKTYDEKLNSTNKHFTTLCEQNTDEHKRIGGVLVELRKWIGWGIIIKIIIFFVLAVISVMLLRNP